MTRGREARLPGLLLATAVVLAAYTLKTAIPGVRLGVVVWAILAGTAANALMRPGPRFGPGLDLCEKKVLEWAIVLLGSQLELQVLARLDPVAMAIILGAMAALLAVAPAAARVLGLPSSYGLLVGIGTSICGSAAIAAIAPSISRDRSETALSIAVINLVGLVSMLLLVWCVRSFGLSLGPSALLLGGALPSVGHAVGAGYAVSEEVGALTVMVKMGRVLCLVPLLVACNTWFAAKKSGGTSGSALRFIPWFVPAFIGVVVLRTIGVFPEVVFGGLSTAGHGALVLAMGAIGLRVDLKAVSGRAARSLVLGALLGAGYAIVVLAAAVATS